MAGGRAESYEQRAEILGSIVIRRRKREITIRMLQNKGLTRVAEED